MNLFGGKLTGGIFAVIGAIIAVILIGIMASPFGSLVAYFADSASDGDGSRFSRVYFPVSGDTTPTQPNTCLLYTSPSPRDRTRSRMPSSA